MSKPPPDEDRCDSLSKAFLRREGAEIYLRCEKEADHDSRWHKSWLKKWTDAEESGFIDVDEELVLERTSVPPMGRLD